MNQIVDAGVLTTADSQPQRYADVEIELTLTTNDDREYTISPALIAAVARRPTDDTIDSYIERHGVHGLATALSHTITREQGETTHRPVADAHHDGVAPSEPTDVEPRFLVEIDVTAVLDE